MNSVRVTAVVVTSACLLGGAGAQAATPHHHAAKAKPKKAQRHSAKAKKAKHHAAKAATPAAAPAAAAPAGDSVVGGGTIDLLEGLIAHVDITAHSGPNGENPTGTADGRALLAGVPTSFGGKVTCLRVKGNTAVVKYAFDHADIPALVGGGIEVFVKDSPTGLNDMQGFLPPQDAVTWAAADPTRCDDLDLATFQTQTGDFTVTDG